AALFAEKLSFSGDASAASGIAAKVSGDDPVKPSFTANRQAQPEMQNLYILGNPPFVGKDKRTDEQTADMEYCCSDVNNFKTLDYVCAWYIKAAAFLAKGRNPSGSEGAQHESDKTLSTIPTGRVSAFDVRVAFVSTNSITQGEQVGVLWSYLLAKGIKIHFAHRTFKWSNEARGKAAVYCVIIGFGLSDVKRKSIFEYETPISESHRLDAKTINPYLVDAPVVVVTSRTQAICDVPKIVFGSMANDGGFLLLTDQEKSELLTNEPQAKQFLRRIYGSEEFINAKNRWCLWLVDASPQELRSMPEMMKRVQNVKDYRLASKRETTRKLANAPFLFGEIRQPAGSYVLIPKVSSERRKFVPIGIMSSDVIASDLCLMVPNATLFHFGVLTSTMHNAWMRQVCGRLESRYRYSNKLVYNNFPWPKNPTEKQIHAIEEKAQKVLDVREKFPTSSLADLYDPLTMPPALVKAHDELDRAVDLAYRPQPFPTEAGRMVFLFELYEKYTATLFTQPSGKKLRKRTR
ncbi:MAG: type IIL restriction-modification enzyme MmeI, partial [Pyrinomonadaceae bacterium]